MKKHITLSCKGVKLPLSIEYATLIGINEDTYASSLSSFNDVLTEYLNFISKPWIRVEDALPIASDKEVIYWSEEYVEEVTGFRNPNNSPDNLRPSVCGWDNNEMVFYKDTKHFGKMTELRVSHWKSMPKSPQK